MMLKIRMVQRIVAGLTFLLALLPKLLLRPQKLNKPHSHPRQKIMKSSIDDGLSWRLAVETNNVRPWRTVPNECYNHVQNYMTGGQYENDIKIMWTKFPHMLLRYLLLVMALMPGFWTLMTLASLTYLTTKEGDLGRGFKVFLLTGRDEATLGKITIDNLHNQGFIGYERLILR
ncbi:HAD superfamily [Sesbania bispinosa]|nr:HAD superfamily [Sesbania bispinosa]